MRLTTVIWLGVFMRQETSRGAYVTVVKKGAQQAGAAFVMHNLGNGNYDIYGPAPQSMFEDGGAERLFEKVLAEAPSEKADEFFEKQKRFDPDIWVIETESGNGPISLNLASPL